MLGRFGYGLMDVSYFFCVFFLGKRNNVGISLVKKTPSWCPSPVSRPFLPSQSLLHHLVAYLVGFQTLVATAKKLGVNLFHYVHDRIVGANALPSLATLIGVRAQLMALGASWQQGP